MKIPDYAIRTYDKIEIEWGWTLTNWTFIVAIAGAYTNNKDVELRQYAWYGHPEGSLQINFLCFYFHLYYEDLGMTI